ncbi:MAG: hypothetical protein NVS1B7_6290 [Candidatus Saccharimonadales bacterium]
MIVDIKALISKHPRISSQVTTDEIYILLSALHKQIESGVNGAVVELGCYKGTMSLYISRFLKAVDPTREFHVYDSFTGLPQKSPEDQSPAGDQFQVGELRATKNEFVRNFKHAHVPLPTIHKQWFEKLKTADMPDLISLAFLDGDYYSSIKQSFKLIEKLLAPRACIIVDDFQSEALPGVCVAVNEWLLQYPKARLKIQASLAIIELT